MIKKLILIAALAASVLTPLASKATEFAWYNSDGSIGTYNYPDGQVDTRFYYSTQGQAYGAYVVWAHNHDNKQH